MLCALAAIDGLRLSDLTYSNSLAFPAKTWTDQKNPVLHIGRCVMEAFLIGPKGPIIPTSGIVQPACSQFRDSRPVVSREELNPVKIIQVRVAPAYKKSELSNAERNNVYLLLVFGSFLMLMHLFNRFWVHMYEFESIGSYLHLDEFLARDYTVTTEGVFRTQL